jgi:hypothetical protein
MTVRYILFRPFLKENWVENIFPSIHEEFDISNAKQKLGFVLRCEAETFSNRDFTLEVIWISISMLINFHWIIKYSRKDSHLILKQKFNISKSSTAIIILCTENIERFRTFLCLYHNPLMMEAKSAFEMLNICSKLTRLVDREILSLLIEAWRHGTSSNYVETMHFGL